MRSKGLTRITLACLGLLGSALVAAQGVRFSELHYDNISTDTGEAIEVAGPAGTDLTGWRVVLYNGSNNLAYGTTTLSGAIPAICGTRGVVVINYPSNGIQNGTPDGMALVNLAGTVVEFLSYEGTMTAADGPAAGILSIDIGQLETDTRSIGTSLARRPNGTWGPSARNSFGACNEQDNTPPVEIVSVTVSPTSASLDVGATVSLSASVLDSGGQPVPGASLTWSSSAPDVASVSSTGVVTGLAEGDATITATATNGVAGSSAVHVNAVGIPPSTSPVRINEIHYDNVGTDANEAIEVEGPAGTDLSGYTLVLYNGNGNAMYNTQPLSGVLPASCDTRGVAFVSYPQDGIQNGSPDGIALIDNTGALVEFLSYEGVLTAADGPALGVTSVDIGASETNAPVGASLQRTSGGAWQVNAASFGACNSDTPGGIAVAITGRTSSDVPLPVGFQDQLFARLADANNQTLPTSFVWTSDTPTVASVDQNGVFTALAAGSAILRATAEDGTSGTITLPTQVAVASATAVYEGNAEFGEPVDGDASDDFIVRYPQYTASYNQNRGTPNWVAYDLEATHFGVEDRCDCFTMDPALPATFPQLTTADYTGAGAFHGYGIDRGHLARSFDRTSGSLDNANTYLFDNIVPQAADLNQGPWAILENFLGDEARLNNKEVYILAGVAGNKGTLKNEGKVVIPTSTWKVAVILGRDQGLEDIHDYRDLEVIAVNMPNEPGVRDVDWSFYITTVDAIESLTGYDLLALLPDEIEAAVESATQPPLAALSGSTSLSEGDSATFSATASLDPNGSITDYAWSFGDGETASGVSVSHMFVQDGVYPVTLTVTDNDGLTATATLNVTVINVAPVVGAIPAASLDAGGAHTVAGSFTDPGADAWTATVDWGDGSSPGQAMLSGHDFSLVHVYPAAGTFTVTVTIADDDAVGSTTQTVTVNAVSSPGAVLDPAYPLIDQLVASRKISRDFGNFLKAQVREAQNQLNRGNTNAAVMMLRVLVGEVDLLVRFRQISATDAAPLRTLFTQVIDAQSVQLNRYGHRHRHHHHHHHRH